MKNEIIKRLKSPVVWASAIAEIASIIALFNENVSSEFKAIATPIIALLVLFGILNNPTDRGNF